MWCLESKAITSLDSQYNNKGNQLVPGNVNSNVYIHARTARCSKDFSAVTLVNLAQAMKSDLRQCVGISDSTPIGCWIRWLRFHRCIQTHLHMCCRWLRQRDRQRERGGLLYQAYTSPVINKAAALISLMRTILLSKFNKSLADREVPLVEMGHDNG